MVNAEEPRGPARIGMGNKVGEGLPLFARQKSKRVLQLMTCVRPLGGS